MQIKKIVNLKTLAVASVALSATAANAALPPEAEAAFTALSTNVTDILAAVWPIAVSLTVGFVGIKLFKKGANKAT